VAIYTLLAARAALAADRPEEALAICEQTEASLADQPMPYLERLVAAALAGRAESALGRDAAARTRLELVEGHLEAFAARPTQVDLRLDHADLLADLGEAARAERAWEEILRERGFTELGLARATAAYRLAASRAARDPDPANRQGMAAAAAEARELRLGLLLGEKL
jgi:hypothetical protein